MFTRHHHPYLHPGKFVMDPLPYNRKDYDNGELPRNFRQAGKYIYGSSLILPHHIKILQQRYNIAHIISLIYGDWLSDFYQDTSIHIHQFPVLGRYIPPEIVKEILELIQTLQGPVVVHCLKGKTRTGKILAAHDIVNEGKSKLTALMKDIYGGDMNISNWREILTEDFS